MYLHEPARKGDLLSESTCNSIYILRRSWTAWHHLCLREIVVFVWSWAFLLYRRSGKQDTFYQAFWEDCLICDAKIVLFNWEHRIKFITLRGIPVAEVLLFNYGDDFPAKHGLMSWSRVGKKDWQEKNVQIRGNRQNPPLEDTMFESRSRAAKGCEQERS